MLQADRRVVADQVTNGKVCSWPSRDCRSSGLAALKLPFANYGTRPAVDIGRPRKRTLKQMEAAGQITASGRLNVM